MGLLPLLLAKEASEASLQLVERIRCYSCLLADCRVLAEIARGQSCAMSELRVGRTLTNARHIHG